ncbi:hypothetical protein HYT45_04410 [Candidatus Uhrbacteria bacterium]|nr:hypothetical protein [Candidatus Uhrbacteria bacterium]
MTLRQYILSMILGTIFAFTGWAIIIISFDPVSANFAGFGLFYLAAFTASTGALAVLGLLVRVYIMRRKTFIPKQVAVAFRQAVLLGSLLLGALILQSKDILNWFNSVLLVSSLTILEFFIISLRRKPRT